MKTLLVMRHAKSDWSAAAADFDRPLNKRGRRDTPLMARLLQALEMGPQRLLASPAARARETAQGLAAMLEAELAFDERLYLAVPRTLTAVLGEQDRALESLLVVGHNPGLEEWLSWLCGCRLRLPTAGLAALHLELDGWGQVRQGQGQLQWFATPRLVEAVLTSQNAR